MKTNTAESIVINKKPIRFWLDPFVWGFLILAASGIVFSSLKSGWTSNLIYILAIVVSLIITFVTFNKLKPFTIQPRYPYLELLTVLSYYLVFMVVSFITRAGGIFSNEFGKWLWFIIIPFLLVFIVRGKPFNIREVLNSVGVHRADIGKALWLGLLVYAVMVPFIIFILPVTQRGKLLGIVHEPGKLLWLLPLSFAFSLFTAATTEEIFFRGLIQSRLAVVMKSELRACLITAVLFGMYHLPYAFYLSSWQTHGNLLWSISGVFSEQTLAGLVLGSIWMRTHNIFGSILFHALVNTLAIMTMLKFG